MKSQKQSIQKSRLIRSKYIQPAVYKKYLDQLYQGEDWVNFSPETIWLDVKDDTTAVPIDEVKNKINALKLVLSGDRYFANPMLFEKCIIAANDKFINWETWQTTSPHELAYGVLVWKAVNDEGFDEDIYNYVRACCSSWGLIEYPDVLKFAQPKHYKSPVSELIIEDIRTEKPRLKPSLHQRDLLDDIQAYVSDRLKRGEY